MNSPRVRTDMISGLADFSDLFVALQAIRGRDRTEAEALLAHIPDRLTQSPCFLDRLNKAWLYDFGDPISTAHGNATGVGLTYHPILKLIEVVECARMRLPEPGFDNYVRRLADPKKHPDMLFEFAPILLLDDAAVVEYEVTGESPRNRTIDWRIRNLSDPDILLEVKSRQADLIATFEHIHAGELDVDGTALPPDHDADLMFRSVESKFLPQSPGRVIQGVWIRSSLMQEESEFRESFLRLDPDLVHFAVLTAWGPAAHVLARDDVVRRQVLEQLRLKQVDGLTFKRPSPG